ncbi:MAG: DUF6516 family protein [bacterium]
MTDARKIREQRDVLADDTMIEIVVYEMDDPDQYPSGYKYSFQHWDPDTGETLLRYDNSHQYDGHPDRHHQHIGDEVKPLSFPGSISTLLDEFVRRVKDDGT